MYVIANDVKQNFEKEMGLDKVGRNEVEPVIQDHPGYTCPCG